MKPQLTYSAGSYQVTGPATFDSLDELAQELVTHADRPGDLRLDLKGMTDCDSVFIATLTSCQQVKSRHNGSLKLDNVPAKLKSMMQVYGLDGCGIEYS